MSNEDLIVVETKKMEDHFTKLMQFVNSNLAESMSFLDNYVDPRGAYTDERGARWESITGEGKGRSHQPYSNEDELRQIREIGRWLDTHNEYAINGRENRTSYVYGWGFTYNVVAHKNASPSDKTVGKVQRVVDEILKKNKWKRKSQENSQRMDRDGEMLLRKFAPADGIMRVRYIEVENLGSPSNSNKKEETYGIRTDPDDHEEILDYYLKDEKKWIPAEQIQHRKRNVDSSCKRGVPTFYPVEKNLKRATKLLNNMSTLSQVQTAIAMIRKMMTSTNSSVKRFLGDVQKQTTGIDSGVAGTGESMPNVQGFPPGSILNSNGSVEYEFPSAGVDPSRYVAALDADLRAAAARVVMPEFMFTSNASNGNYASTMVAEGPAVKMFQRLQHDEIMYEEELMNDALEVAVQFGLLTESEVEETTVQISGPEIAVRNRLEDAQVAEKLDTLGCMSKQTTCEMFSLDYQQEQSNIEDHNERIGDIPNANSDNLPQLPPAPGEEEEEPAKPTEDDE